MSPFDVRTAGVDTAVGLAMERIHHTFTGDPVLGGVDVAVSRGSVACLLGPSGCGKTTLLRLAAGLERLQQGRITIAERPVADAGSGLDLAPEARRVGLMFQDYALFPHLTVAENVAFGLTRHGRGRNRRHHVRAALDRVGLGALADVYPNTLSGGEQQRCALLRALVPEPDVLLLDEPFSGLDVTLRAQVREETLSILRDAGIATLIVTHDPEEAMFLADELVIMERGRIVQRGTPEAIYLRPETVFVAGLFGAPNRIDGTVNPSGVIASPLGPLPAPHLRAGDCASVLIRPEGILVSLTSDQNAVDSTVWGCVVSARLLGRASQIRLRVDGLAAPLVAHVPGVVLPAPGTSVSLRLEPNRAFVFAHSG